MKYLKFLFIMIFLVACNSTKKDSIWQKIKKIENNKLQGIYYDFFIDYYFNNNYEFPENLHQFYTFANIKLKSKGYDLVRLTDPFSSSNEDLLYIPLYCKTTKKRDGFVLISRGEDGKIDNNFIDTLFIEKFKSNYKFYNKYKWDPGYYNTEIGYSSPSIFSLKNKDLLIEYYNMNESYTNNKYKFVKIESLEHYIKHNNFRRAYSVYNYYAYVDKYDKKNVGTYVYSHTYNDLVINSYLYLPEPIDIKINDTLKLIGRMVEYDTIARNLIFEHCMVVK